MAGLFYHKICFWSSYKTIKIWIWNAKMYHYVNQFALLPSIIIYNMSPKNYTLTLSRHNFIIINQKLGWKWFFFKMLWNNSTLFACLAFSMFNLKLWSNGDTNVGCSDFTLDTLYRLTRRSKVMPVCIPGIIWSLLITIGSVCTHKKVRPGTKLDPFLVYFTYKFERF